MEITIFSILMLSVFSLLALVLGDIWINDKGSDKAKAAEYSISLDLWLKDERKKPFYSVLVRTHSGVEYERVVGPEIVKVELEDGSLHQSFTAKEASREFVVKCVNQGFYEHGEFGVFVPLNEIEHFFVVEKEL